MPLFHRRPAPRGYHWVEGHWETNYLGTRAWVKPHIARDASYSIGGAVPEGDAFRLWTVRERKKRHENREEFG
jgi:hypothetical protein